MRAPGRRGRAGRACVPTCTASSAQSWTVTRVSWAPSPTTTSTLSASVALPVWSRTTVASASAPDLDDDVAVRDASAARHRAARSPSAGEPTASRGHRTTSVPVGEAVRPGRDPVERAASTDPTRGSSRSTVDDGHLGRGVDLDHDLPSAGAPASAGVQPAQASERREPPLLLAARAGREVGDVERRDARAGIAGLAGTAAGAGSGQPVAGTGRSDLDRGSGGGPSGAGISRPRLPSAARSAG